MIEVTGLYAVSSRPSIEIVAGVPEGALAPQVYDLGQDRGVLYVCDVQDNRGYWGESVGYASLSNVGAEDVLEAYYDLSPYGMQQYARKGIMFQAMRVMAARAFTGDQPCSRIDLLIDQDNTPSIGLATKLGAECMGFGLKGEDATYLQYQLSDVAFARSEELRMASHG